MKQRHESFLGLAGLQRLLCPSTKPVQFMPSRFKCVSWAPALFFQLKYTRIRFDLTFLFQNGMLCSCNEIHPLHLPMG